MAKNERTGAVVVFARLPVTYEGTVIERSDAGVLITTRPHGRQIEVDRLFSAKDVIASTDEGAGFVTVFETRVVTAYHGGITVSKGEISVSLENGRTITFAADTENLQVHYDANEEPSSQEAKLGRGNSSKLITSIGRRDEKSGGSAKKAKKAKDKKKK